MSAARYATVVLGSVAVTLAAAWPALAAEWRAAVLTGAALASVNTVLAYLAAIGTMDKSPNVFLGAVLGGMVARMGLMLVAFVMAVRMGALPAVPLAASLLAYFVGFLVFELALLHRRTSARAVAR